MTEPLKVLFATDFSPAAKVAEENVALLNKKYEMDISLIHVIPSFWKNWFSSGLAEKEAIQRLTIWQTDLLGEDANPEKLFVQIGNPTNEIISTSTKLNSELIVVARKIKNGETRYKAGTTAENVLRHADKSVMVCKSKKISKILCAIDGSAHSEKVLSWSLDLAKRFAAKLDIVIVCHKENPISIGMDEEAIKEMEETVKEQITKRTATYLEKFDMSDIQADVHYLWGTPSHVILDMAEDYNCDLIVIGSKGDSTLEHALLGTTAEKVLRFAPCSLLVVR